MIAKYYSYMVIIITHQGKNPGESDQNGEQSFMFIKMPWEKVNLSALRMIK